MSVLSVRPFAWNNSASSGWIFIKLDVRVFFENLQIQISLKSDKKKGYFT